MSNTPHFEDKTQVEIWMSNWDTFRLLAYLKAYSPPTTTINWTSSWSVKACSLTNYPLLAGDRHHGWVWWWGVRECLPPVWLMQWHKTSSLWLFSVAAYFIRFVDVDTETWSWDGLSAVTQLRKPLAWTSSIHSTVLCLQSYGWAARLGPCEGPRSINFKNWPCVWGDAIPRLVRQIYPREAGSQPWAAEARTMKLNQTISWSSCPWIVSHDE